MPYISTKTTVTISAEKRESIKTKLGKAIEIILANRTMVDAIL